MKLNPEGFTTYKSLYPVLRTQTTSLLLVVQLMTRLFHPLDRRMGCSYAHIKFVNLLFLCSLYKIDLIKDFKYISDRLVKSGLLKSQDASQLQNKLQEVLVTPIDQRTKATMAQKLIRNSLIGYFGSIPPRIVQTIGQQSEKNYEQKK